jgi:hypothetical protein
MGRNPLWEPPAFIQVDVHLLGKGSLKRVFKRRLNRGVIATTDTGDENTNCPVWRLLFGSLEVAEDSSFVNLIHHNAVWRGGITGSTCSWGHKHRNLALHVKESRIRDSKTWSRVSRESDLRTTALARASRICRIPNDVQSPKTQ